MTRATETVNNLNKKNRIYCTFNRFEPRSNKFLTRERGQRVHPDEDDDSHSSVTTLIPNLNHAANAVRVSDLL